MSLRNGRERRESETRKIVHRKNVKYKIFLNTGREKIRNNVRRKYIGKNKILTIGKGKSKTAIYYKKKKTENVFKNWRE